MQETRIVVFDVETTGTDKKQDQVIELCMQMGLSSEHDSPVVSRTWRIRPTIAIHPAAQKVHGISMEDLADCPPFAEIAEEVREVFLEATMLVGYNVSFDIDMLQAEYRRLRQPPLELSDKLVVDPFRLWQQCEPRSLMHAHRRFVGREFDSAHSAAADVAATGRVLLGMLKSYGLPENWPYIADVCEPTKARWIGGTKHLCWDEDGQIVLGFGKHAGIPLAELASGSKTADYLLWILDSDFPEHMQEACRQALALGSSEFADWAIGHFPKPRERVAAPAVPVPKSPNVMLLPRTKAKKVRESGEERQQNLFPNDTNPDIEMS